MRAIEHSDDDGEHERFDLVGPQGVLARVAALEAMHYDVQLS